MEGLEDRVQELSGDVALLCIQLARAQAEKQTLAQRLQRLQVHEYTSVAVDTPVCAYTIIPSQGTIVRISIEGISLRQDQYQGDP